MRLAGQIKQGYFPAPSEAISALCRHLTSTEGACILDPCAGEDKALMQIAATLGIPDDRVYAVELNRARAQRIAEARPEIKFLGPCRFLSAKISRASFSCVYCNPPFDHEFGGGGREEKLFVRSALPLLVPGGVFVLVCPVDQAIGRHDLCEVLDTQLEGI
jgi:hypothetical protein